MFIFNKYLLLNASLNLSLTYMLYCFLSCRDSSVGRALDWRSKGPRFDPGSRHLFSIILFYKNIFNCLWIWILVSYLNLLLLNHNTIVKILWHILIQLITMQIKLVLTIKYSTYQLRNLNNLLRILPLEYYLTNDLYI